jgi:hypothetical protein
LKKEAQDVANLKEDKVANIKKEISDDEEALKKFLNGSNI